MKRFIRNKHLRKIRLTRDGESLSGHRGKALWRWLIGFCLTVGLVLMFPRAQSLRFADMREGSVSTRRIVAPFDFEILKTREEYQRDREMSRREVYPVFRRDAIKVREMVGQIDDFFRRTVALRESVARDRDFLQTARDSLFSSTSVGVLDSVSRDLIVDPREGLARQDLNRLRTTLVSIVRDIASVGVLESVEEEKVTPDRRLILAEVDEEVILGIDDFYDLTEARTRAAGILQETYPGRRDIRQMGFGLLGFFLRPNLIYDELLHQERIEEAMARVPLSSGFVYENEKIVDRNERITPEIRKKLVSLATKMAEKGMQEGGIRRFFPVLGKVALTAILLFMLGFYIYIERPEILNRIKSVLLISLIVFLISLLAFLIHRLEASEYLLPAALGAMLLTAVYDRRMGFAGAAVLGVLVGGLWGNEYNLTIYSFFLGIIGVITIQRVRDRRQLITATVYLIGATILVITGLGFLRFLSFREILRQWPYGAITGLLTPIITYGLLPLIESVFDITTDFSLLELSNLNHPLLKRISVEASGTYHHSIIVGNLAEAAAQAVGANSLLAKVGSYYHDVGKLEKAEYFVENQNRGENPHEKLTPRMSALILMNHVKRGMELAEKYKLPKSIMDIIQQHQGSTVMSFFYRKAVDKNGEEETSEEDYRYPGPRPQSKEAAIVMLADTVEAAARALKEPTHSRLKGLVEDLVDARFQEGQLDESPLTLKDLQKIKESFLMVLAGIFHARVEYPEKDDRDDKKERKENPSPVPGNTKEKSGEN